MYSKKEIIEEIKRVAAKLDVKSLKEKDFGQNSMIPFTTIKYYLGSWKNALKESGLGPVMKYEKSDLEPKGDDELLLELIRLYDEYGETPTKALVASKGKYTYQNYSIRWKSLNEAFLLAKEKFPPQPRVYSSSSEKKAADIKEEEITQEYSEKKSILSDPADFSELGIYQNHDEEKNDKSSEIETDTLAVEIPIAVEGVGNLPEDSKGGDKMTGDQKIKLIPQTIKPKIARKKPKLVGEPIHFRGLQFAPINDKGVVFLFGMISHELGFVIEGVRTESPDCEGKRCLDTDSNQWERVKIDFKYRSSDSKVQGYNENESDIIVCWIHDWEECPLEVLELQSTIELLENSKQ